MLVKILILVFYIIPTIFSLKRVIKDSIGGDFEFSCLILFVPSVSLVICMLLIADKFNFDEKIEKLMEEIRIYIKRKKELKERKKRIKLGIVRINDIDPFGEETWESLK